MKTVVGHRDDGRARDERHAPEAGDHARHAPQRALEARAEWLADGVVALEGDGEDGEHGRERDGVLQHRDDHTCSGGGGGGGGGGDV